MKHINATSFSTSRAASSGPASVLQTHYFIIGTTYQRDDVRDRQRDLFLNCYAVCRASYVAFNVALDVALGGGPRVVVSNAAFHARVRGSVPGLGGLKET